METTIVQRGYMGKMDKNMKLISRVSGLGLRVKEVRTDR